ncbi:serine hydrolase domain-containing protein [Streptomyces sp. NPDC029526]|uniref:serine hydrolase domain-containing protein n=1 Tax=Streptomyces sp. NPDC029526 TaxID=3155728 RepID=UPI0033D3439E
MAALGLVAATAAVPASAAASASPAVRSAATLDPASIDRFVRDYVRQTRLPGAVVAVTRGDRVVHTAGYGHTASGRAMTERTRLPVASLSKSMTALAVLKLVEAGKVGLDQPVHRLLPEFTMADPRFREITVRQLLTQTSGMADSAYPDLARPQPHTLQQAVAAMRGARLATAPGTRHRYHNPNYFVAARLVEVVGGRPFADFLSAELFAPLGMTHTTSVDTTAEMPDRARGHVRAYGTTIVRPHPRWFTAGGHGVVTTADDLARWLIAQNNRGVSADGHRIADPRSVRLAQTPPKVPGDTDYAMGWARYRHDDGTDEIRHNGQLLTHNATATLLPDTRTGIAVVTNTGLISGDDAAQISLGLVDLARGKNPEVAKPFSMTADWVLAALTLLAAGLGVRGVLRSGRWARRAVRRAWWRTALRMLPQALPLLFFAQLASLVGLLMGRSGTLSQTAYAWPALVVCAAAGGLASLAVVTARALALALRLRHARHGGRDEEAAAPLDAREEHETLRPA